MVVNRLLDAGPEGFEGGMATQKYASMTHCSKATAFRELEQLSETDFLQGATESSEVFVGKDEANGNPGDLIRLPSLH